MTVETTSRGAQTSSDLARGGPARSAAVLDLGPSSSVCAPQDGVTAVDEQIVEIVSDSGEGAQRCGQSFAALAARSGLGIWTVEIIPAEIQPARAQRRGGEREPSARR